MGIKRMVGGDVQFGCRIKWLGGHSWVGGQMEGGFSRRGARMG